MPCQHELFVCRKVGLDPTASLYFKQRWFLMYPQKLRERLYQEPDGIMLKHNRTDWSQLSKVHLEKLKTSNHPDLVKDFSNSKKSKKSKKSRKEPADLGDLVIQDNVSTTTMTGQTSAETVEVAGPT